MSAPTRPQMLLGVCDENIPNSLQTTWTVNKIGGGPDIMYKPDSFEYPVCGLCGKKLLLVTQIYCPLELQQFDRTLYVFACVIKTCWNKSRSWTVVRLQIPTALENKQQMVKVEAPVAMATDEWCDDADDWGNGEDEWSTPAACSNPSSGNNLATQNSDENDLESTGLSQRMMGIDLNNDSHHGDDKSANHGRQLQKVHGDMQMFQSYFVNVFEEPESEEIVLTSHEKRLMKEYQQREGVDFNEWQDTLGAASGRGGGGKESYEKTSIKHGDKYFHKFSKKLALCPEQCIRYSLNGKPLYLTSPDNSNEPIPCCTHCGSPRIFELQLMPGLVNQLTVPDEPEISLEFGVVLVYTCRDSCWDQGKCDA